jgi:excisionase family DNA binding protein
METTTTDEGTRSPWLTPSGAAARAKCGTKIVYNAVRTGRLRAVRLGDRNQIRIHEAWVDAWMTAAVINPDAPGGDVGAPPLPFAARRAR